MEKTWTPHSIQGALATRVVALILNYDEDLLRPLLQKGGAAEAHLSAPADLATDKRALVQLALIILGHGSAISVQDLFRHFAWEDWSRVLHALCLLFEIDPGDWPEWL